MGSYLFIYLFTLLFLRISNVLLYLHGKTLLTYVRIYLYEAVFVSISTAMGYTYILTVYA